MSITLGNLLNEIKYGKDFINTKETVNEAVEYIDSDYGIFLASKRMRNILESFDNEKPYFKKLVRIASNFSDYENRILEAKQVSTVYTKMKLDDILENYNEVVSLLEKDKKLLRESDREALGKILSTVKLGFNKIRDEKNVSTKSIVEATGILKHEIEKDFSIISECI